MGSVFKKLWRLGPAAFVLKAIVAALVADALLLGFIFARRAYRKSYFRKRDARVFELRQIWEALISGQIPHERWRKKPFDRRIVESIALDEFEGAGPEQSRRLLRFLRSSGLIEKLVHEARRLHGWRRMRALVALGRTRAPEGIPALTEALRDRHLEIRLAALRGLGRTASPQAGEEILSWVGETGLTVPALPLQAALIQCCAERPRLLLPLVQHAEGPLREVIGRVLGEVATPSLGLDLLQFVGDEREELRAAAARLAPQGDPKLAFEVLSELAEDSVWFVRLRAVVSLGKLADSKTIPTLLKGLTDSHRLVRLRAAEGLVGRNAEIAPIFQRVAETRDRYGLHAYLTALENANLRGKLEAELEAGANMTLKEKDWLQEVLRAGTFPAEEPVRMEPVPSTAGSQP